MDEWRCGGGGRAQAEQGRIALTINLAKELTHFDGV